MILFIGLFLLRGQVGPLSYRRVKYWEISQMCPQNYFFFCRRIWSIYLIPLTLGQLLSWTHQSTPTPFTYVLFILSPRFFHVTNITLVRHSLVRSCALVSAGNILVLAAISFPHPFGRFDGIMSVHLRFLVSLVQLGNY